MAAVLRLTGIFLMKKIKDHLLSRPKKFNGNCHYMLQGENVPPFGIWMCGDSWWLGEVSDKGECKGIWHASTDSKHVHVQDNSLQWKWAEGGNMMI